MAAVAGVAALTWQVPLAQLAIIAGAAIVGRLVLDVPEPSGAADGVSPVSRRVGMVAGALFATLLVGLPLLRVVGGQAVAIVDAFYRSGALVFGGGHVVLPLLHSAVVDPGWVGNDQFVAGYGAAQAVPGPLFTFAGYLGTVSSVAPNGAVGGVIAVLAIFLPGLLLLLAAMPFWHELRGWRAARSAFAGVNAAVVGILAAALYTPVWTSAVTAPIDVAIAAAGFALLLTNRVPPIVVVGLSALAGQLLTIAT